LACLAVCRDIRCPQQLAIEFPELEVVYQMLTLDERLDRIEVLLAALVERQQVKDYYEIEEFARLVCRDRFTVREWARNGRVHADKKLSGRGAHARWVVSHDELLRYQKEGLLPPQTRSCNARLRRSN
jgi:hypothetical protein